MFNQEEYQTIKKEFLKEVKILGVTKTKSNEDIIEAVNSGVKIIGENYISEAKRKYETLKEFFQEKNVSFHLIGHLQSNKVNEAVKMFDCIETVDSIKLAEKINNSCKKINKKIDVMIEINFDESQKSGINLNELDSLISKINSLENINLIGLMCIPPIGKEKKSFEEMKKLKEVYKLKELSMGMSSDYKLAVENGATIIRLGRILFGERN